MCAFNSTKVFPLLSFGRLESSKEKFDVERECKRTSFFAFNSEFDKLLIKKCFD